MRTVVLSAALLIACGGPSAEPESAEPVTEAPAAEDPAAMAEFAPAPDARVFFVSPEAGETLTSPVRVVMGVEGMEVRPAGELAEGSGHHHLLIDVGHIAEGDVVPTDTQHIHYGQGETEAELPLEPGDYTLRLQFADWAHRSFGERLTDTVQITVAEP